MRSPASLFDTILRETAFLVITELAKFRTTRKELALLSVDKPQPAASVQLVPETLNPLADICKHSTKRGRRMVIG